MVWRSLAMTIVGGDLHLGCRDGSDVEDNMLDDMFSGMADIEETYDLSDRQIANALRSATDARIGNALLTETGIDSAHMLIAIVMGHPPYEVDEEALSGADLKDLSRDALNALCGLVWRRVGRKPEKWLNSWKLITFPLAARVQDGHVEDLYECEYPFAA